MQPLPAGPTGSILTIPTFSAANLGRYQVRVSGASGSVLSGVAELAARFLPLAPTTRARDALAESGFADADTVQRFLASEQLQEKSAGRVLLIDEAGLLSTRLGIELGRRSHDDPGGSRHPSAIVESYLYCVR